MLNILSLYYHNYNYGGMLQSYALSKFLCSRRFSSLHLAFEMSRRKRRPVLQKVKSLNCKRISLKLYNILCFVLSVFIRESINKREMVFLHFQETMVPHGEVCNAHNIIKTTNFDNFFIAGSDQIWNPMWTEDAYFLDFVPDHNGKIAYAASIGANSVSQAFLEHVTPLLNRFDFISVREESAKEILQPYVDKPIKVVLDPTLLLTRDEWDKITVTPAVPQPYIFVYLLGEKREHRRLIKRYAKTLGLKIVFLPHVHFRFNPADCFFADYNLYDVGPREFVGLIKNAEMVITDSFHGCVFSIIYQKKFWALKRHKDSEKENMNSRLYTLFDSLGLRDRLIDDESAEYDAKSLNRQIDYSQVEANLDALRKDSSDFLLNAIKSVQQRMKDEARDTQ